MRVATAPLVQAIVLACLAWFAAQLQPQFDFGFPLLVPLSSLVMAVGVVILFLAVRAFVVRGTTIDPLHPERAEKLVTSGLFRLSRNPMYLGMLLLLSGIALALGNWISLLAPVLFIVSMNILQIKPEEVALRQKFGEEYEKYCQQTRRWI